MKKKKERESFILKAAELSLRTYSGAGGEAGQYNILA